MSLHIARNFLPGFGDVGSRETADDCFMSRLKGRSSISCDADVPNVDETWVT